MERFGSIPVRRSPVYLQVREFVTDAKSTGDLTAADEVRLEVPKAIRADEGFLVSKFVVSLVGTAILLVSLLERVTSASVIPLLGSVLGGALGYCFFLLSERKT